MQLPHIPTDGPKRLQTQHRSERTMGITAALVLLVGVFSVIALGCGSSGDDTTPKPGGKADAGKDAGDGSTSDVVTADGSKPDGGTECVPKTCEQLEASCGTVPDGCGDKIACGECADGQTCGGGGANECGTGECTPKSCVEVGADCGWASDGCATAIDCGGCAPPEVCSSDSNQCGCTPKTCAQLGVNCGTVPDGCLGTLDCGACGAGQSCGGGGPNVCGDATCTPKSCAQLGASCGFVSDGCSQALDCGECAAPGTCGGGGVLNQCGCTPKSCSQLGASCGAVDTGCGDVDCGDCTPPDTCGGAGVANQCGCVCTLPHAKTKCLAGACSIDGCDPGWGNCDATTTNGCELNLTNDVLNCGACGTGCSFANAGASCASGACVLGVCNAGFADCDGDPSNGCEANLKADPANCDACANACPALGGTPVCVDGVCDVSNCSVGLGDCDPGVAGCETDTTTSAAHCGFCNNACSFPNASAKCTASVCQIDSCNGGWGNCDTNESNGCETNTAAAVTHCGACGNACPNRPHATSKCTNGSCGFTCDSGWQNCDGSAANGCEINTQTNVNHCGTCTTVCNLAHATAACTNGTCTVASCNAGYGDCNGNPADGCETNTNTNPSYCGSCGNSCSVANGTAGCQAGSCTVASCNAGWANCDGLVANGCEANIANDATHCGSCTKVCNGSQGTPICASGTCTIACNPGYGNCDGNPDNGCEVNTQSSTTNCGACGQTCSSNHVAPVCSNGTCTGTCSSGWADCDGNKLSNGCETNINTSVSNCGACGVNCSTNHVTALCTAGSCVGACATGWADCNGNKQTDGCEINTNTNVSNCGACNTPCSTNHVTASCSAGVCAGACASGWADCNGNKQTDGCEVNTAADVLHCGSCTKNCMNPLPANTTAADCVSSACEVRTCESGWYDQNGGFANGCECQNDSIGDTCAARTTLPTVGTATTSVTYPSTTEYYSIAPTTDSDWYQITFNVNTTSCNRKPRVSLSDASGQLRMRIQYGTSCSSSTGYACNGTGETGHSGSANIRTWDFNHSKSCAVGGTSTNDIDPGTGYLASPMTWVMQIRVFHPSPPTTHSTCFPYRLVFTRQ